MATTPILQQRHFEWLAENLKKTKPEVKDDLDRLRLIQWEFTVRIMAVACAADNGKFKPELFFRACDFTPRELTREDHSNVKTNHSQDH